MQNENNRKSLDLMLGSYDYHLPKHLIRERPLKDRDQCKLLIYKKKSDEIIHGTFSDLPLYLSPDDLMVLNQSKVFPARLKGHKKSGGKVEILLISPTPTTENGIEVYSVMIGSNHKKMVGDEFSFLEGKLNGKIISKVEERDSVYFNVSFQEENPISYFAKYGQIPIPSYIRKGESDEEDHEDYQTVYASQDKSHQKSLAAPTAGLHFTDPLFKKLSQKGIETAKATLHVGLGTFAPVKTENIPKHDMHFENYFVEDTELAKIKAHQGNLIAVGTTSLRVLEDLYQSNQGEFPDNCPMRSTNIFLHPGKNVGSIKGLITNFHLPKSTLIMLVSSIIGREKTLALYEEAIKKNYHFYSYGDAMLILR